MTRRRQRRMFADAQRGYPLRRQTGFERERMMYQSDKGTLGRRCRPISGKTPNASPSMTTGTSGGKRARVE